MSGCVTSPKGKLQLKTKADPDKNKWKWVFQQGIVDAADVGNPAADTDLAICVYDAGATLVGGQLLQGAPEWTADAKGLKYKDKLLTRLGLKKIKIKYGTGKGQILVLAKGAGIGTPATQVTGPITAQLVNLETGACWESTFTNFTQNEAGMVKATLP